MMSFQSIREKYDRIDFPTLNRMRMVAILACSLVFCVSLYHNMLGSAPAAKNEHPVLAPPFAQGREVDSSKHPLPSVDGQRAGLASVHAVLPPEARLARGGPSDAYAPSAPASQEGDSDPIPEMLPAVAEEEPVNSVTTPVSATSEQLPKNLSAKSIIIADASSAGILYEKNADAKMPQASLTKLMTAVVVREHSKPDETVEITKRAISLEGASGSLVAGERFTAPDLLKVMLIVSSNDAAAAFEDHFASKGLDLVALMNEKAQKLGMRNTHFANVSGLDAENHYASARDLAKLVSFSLSDGPLWDMLSLRSDTVWSVNKKIRHALSSTNELLVRGVPGILGGKTGYTKNALGCMITLAERKDGKAIIIVLGSQDRFADTKALVQFTEL